MKTIEQILPRIMIAKFNENPSWSLTSCYSRTNVSEENDLLKFTNDYQVLLQPFLNTIF